MTETAASPESGDRVESVLRAELATSDAMLGMIAPILRHLVASDDSSVFSDEIIARVRGVIADIARQLIDEVAAAAGSAERGEPDPEQFEELAAAIAGMPALLGHVHALALEWQQTDRLQGRLALDPVLSPLLQALIASPDPATSGLAMNLLAAQARFCQNQRRMKLPIGELPGDLLHAALVAMRTVMGGSAEADGLAARAEAMIRARFDESCSRLGLIARLVTGMGGGAVAALSITHAGPAMFFSALALASGQDRDLAVLCASDRQQARLALALRAAGLKPQAIAEQFLALHPEVTLPENFEQLGADRAAAILAVSGSYVGA